MNRKRVIALIRKEFFQIIRDPSSIIIAFILPIILLFLFGYGISLDPNEISVGLVIEDTSPEVHSMMKSFKNTKYFLIQTDSDRKPLQNKLDKGEVRGIIVVPSDFTKKLKDSSSRAVIQVIADGSEPNTASFVENYTKGIFGNWLKQQEISAGSNTHKKIEIESRFWYNPELKSRYFLVPGALAIIMTLIGTLLTALVIAREWERGTMEAIMSTPASMIEIITGKLIPYFVLGMSSMFICTLVAILLFRVPFNGSLLLLMLVSAMFLVVALETGLFISITTKNQFVASQVALISGFLPAFILSGFVFEISSMPLPIQTISLFIPAKYFISCLNVLFLTGNVMEVILPNLAVLALMALVMHKINTTRIHKRLA